MCEAGCSQEPCTATPASTTSDNPRTSRTQSPYALVTAPSKGASPQSIIERPKSLSKNVPTQNPRTINPIPKRGRDLIRSSTATRAWIRRHSTANHATQFSKYRHPITETRLATTSSLQCSRFSTPCTLWIHSTYRRKTSCAYAMTASLRRRSAVEWTIGRVHQGQLMDAAWAREVAQTRRHSVPMK